MNDPVLCIWSSSSPNGRRNLLFGLDTQTWGFKDDEPHYSSPIRWVLFGHDHDNGSPRADAKVWQAGTLSLVLCELTTPRYEGHAPHWPDEVESGQVIYPYRLGITPVGTLADISASPGDMLGLAGSEGLRMAAIRNRGVLVQLDVAPLLQRMGVPTAPGSSVPDLGRTAGSPRPSLPPVRGRRGAGRSNDPEFTSTVEKHAVKMAIEHMEKLGWHDVEELGKPFDLVFRKPGEEKHVEVKGTSGAGAEVEYTANEVAHFRSCPYGADLIVVRDIAVDRSVRPYAASGGKLLHVQNYTAPGEDLQATRWLGRVPGWK
ncbi:DUF3883 domain-containing protein [Verrucosispora sp. WMMD1129]|uniref:protein NO VEIN domain-containing protein n=1 Tax=Verrucosispora sp. WMMD1129 TaxID=3016093 RepID=UPI00249C78E2|nr:DUF3883 domain-containing protein [Verrucosispora sp. WMMD1129]WFE47113.1 DUF3883 domain-containing protein [Verrucosispora sp. WMMD1129]